MLGWRRNKEQCHYSHCHTKAAELCAHVVSCQSHGTTNVRELGAHQDPLQMPPKLLSKETVWTSSTGLLDYIKIHTDGFFTSKYWGCHSVYSENLKWVRPVEVALYSMLPQSHMEGPDINSCRDCHGRKGTGTEGLPENIRWWGTWSVPIHPPPLNMTESFWS